MPPHPCDACYNKRRPNDCVYRESKMGGPTQACAPCNKLKTRCSFMDAVRSKPRPERSTSSTRRPRKQSEESSRASSRATSVASTRSQPGRKAIVVIASKKPTPRASSRASTESVAPHSSGKKKAKRPKIESTSTSQSRASTPSLRPSALRSRVEPPLGKI